MLEIRLKPIYFYIYMYIFFPKEVLPKIRFFMFKSVYIGHLIYVEK